MNADARPRARASRASSSRRRSRRCRARGSRCCCTTRCPATSMVGRARHGRAREGPAPLREPRRVLAVYPHEPLPDFTFHAPVLPAYRAGVRGRGGRDARASTRARSSARAAASGASASNLSFRRISQFMTEIGTAFERQRGAAHQPSEAECLEHCRVALRNRWPQHRAPTCSRAAAGRAPSDPRRLPPGVSRAARGTALGGTAAAAAADCARARRRGRRRRGRARRRGEPRRAQGRAKKAQEKAAKERAAEEKLAASLTTTHHGTCSGARPRRRRTDTVQ